MPETFVYKAVEGCEIKLDVYPAPGSQLSPVLLSAHGGGPITGSRKDIAAENGSGLLRELCTEAGYTQVSIDYRLAPETKLPGIIDDLRDAWRWLQAELPRHFEVDTSRVGVIGRSAGGYLALMAGFCVSPRPRAIVSLYGYGDLLWSTEPSDHYRTMPLVSEPDARSATEAGLIAEVSPDRPRMPVYLYCRQQGAWLDWVAGFGPEDKRLVQYSPILNGSAGYPPTLLLHGDADRDVPYEESVAMSSALTRAGVHNRLITIAGADHLFDRAVTRQDMASAQPPAAAASFGEVVAFLSSTCPPGPGTPVAPSA